MVYDPQQGTQLVQHSRVPVVDSYPTHEEIVIDQEKQTNYMKCQKGKQKSPSPSPNQRRKPPPKPPRDFPVEEGGGRELTVRQREEIHNVIKRVDSIVDVDSKRLFRQMVRNPPAAKPKPHLKPKPPVMRKHSQGSNDLPAPSSDLLSSSSSAEQPTDPSRNRSPSHVASLIQKFEFTPPSPQSSPSSPKKVTPFKRANSLETITAPSLQHPPAPPPKPRAPPRPPKPLPSFSPILPPRTPLPRLPPKPPGSMPPALLPKQRKRSLSDATSTKPPRPVMERIIEPPIPPKRSVMLVAIVTALEQALIFKFHFNLQSLNLVKNCDHFQCKYLSGTFCSRHHENQNVACTLNCILSSQSVKFISRQTT